MHPIYLDNAATTPMLPEVADAMREVQVEHFGNPSSTHSFGERPQRLLEDARQFMRGSFGAGRLVLTSGGSEADFLGVCGAALAREPGRVLVGTADHDAVLAQRTLLTRMGYEFVEYGVDASGAPSAATLEPLLGPDVRAIAILHGHNELGSLAPLDEIVPLIRERAPDAHVHLDLVQAYGKVAFDFDSCPIDSAAISAHKFHGPRGVGCLALSNSARIAPIQPAGGQEDGMRGGTENVAGAVAMARAAEIVLTDLAQQRAHSLELNSTLFEAIASDCPGTARLGDPERGLPQILSLRIPGVRGNTLQETLAARGVAFSTGSACHGEDDSRENHVLKAIGLDRRAAREVVRFSFSRTTSSDDVARAAELIVTAIHELAALAPKPATDRPAAEGNADV